MMRRAARMLGLLGLLSGVIYGQTPAPLADAIQRTREDIDAARRDVTETYERLAAEKAELTAECEALAEQIRELDAQRSASAEAMVRQRAEVDSARQDADHFRELYRYVGNMALEYRRAFETRLTPAQAESLEAALTALDADFVETPDALAPETLERLLDLSFRRCEESLGGERFPGEALDIDGLTLGGVYMTFGPLSFFHDARGEAVGLAVQQVGSLTPTVFTGFDEEETVALRALFESGQARVPVDVTMGSGVRLRETRESIPEHLRKGGFIIIPLLLLGGVCVLIICYKLLVVVTLPTARCQRHVIAIVEAVNAGHIERAEELTRGLRHPLRSVISEGIVHRNAAKEHLEEILYEQILAQVPALERFLSPLAVCASAAPLLGLLGTVTGMIHTFRLITVFGTGDARLLSAGISEALITTEVGLMIAIPALLFHAYLSRRVRRTVGMAQEVSLTFVNGIKLKGSDSA